MRNIKFSVQFDGTRYSGWQRLKDSDNTIQGKLEDVLSKMTGEKISVIGCSRTDKGVHAKSLVSNFHTKTDMKIEEIQKYMNYYLPEDISVTYVDEASDKFHSRYNAKSKIYRYTIDNNMYPDVFTRKFAAHIPDVLDIKAMEKASEYLIGLHDFEAFTTMKSKKKGYERNIHSISITKKNNYVYIDFEGDGFLHNMIRILTGTLVRVGKKELSAADFAAILESKDRSISGPVAPSKGLTLMQVNFS